MTDQPPANKKAIITEAAASGVGGFGYFPEWDELEGTIINPTLDQIWAGEVKAAEALPAALQAGGSVPEGQGIPEEVDEEAVSF